MKNLVLVFLFCTAATLFLRFFVSIAIRFQAMSKKEYREYRKNAKCLKIWFFIDSAVFCKDKYSKSEHRKIKHTMHLEIYTILTIVSHLVMLTHGVALLLYWRSCISSDTAELLSKINLYMILV